MHAIIVQLAMLSGAADGWANTFTAGGMHLSQAAGAMLITAVWQGALVAAGLGFSLRISKRVSAGLRFALWTGGFLAVLGLPFLPLFAKPELWHGVLAPAAGTAQSWLRLDERWSIAIAAVWAAASIYRAADLAIHAVKLRRLWKSAALMPGQPVPALKLWGRKQIEICTSDALDRPSVIGFFAPRILIPEWLSPQITREELEQIVLHETEHLRRGDDWTNLLQKLSLVVFPLNPALLWMERQLCLEREMACDEAVIRVTRAPKAYAACLTSLAERGMERRMEALSLGAWQRKPELVRRVQSILLRRQLLGPLGMRGIAVMMASGLLLGTVELARCPQLVTFTAVSHEQLSARATLPASDKIDAGGDIVFHDSPHAVTVSSTGMGNAHMVELRATMPVRAGVAFTPSAAAMHRRGGKQKAFKEAGHRSLPAQAKLPGQQQMNTTLKADLNDTGPLPGEESGFVVFTAWEEIVPGANGNTTTAAFAKADATSALPSAGAKPDSDTEKAPTPGRVTVTQLVFRVVPASYRSRSQAIVPLRDGWLVIQL